MEEGRTGTLGGFTATSVIYSIAQHYHSLSEGILQAVQNSIDAGFVGRPNYRNIVWIEVNFCPKNAKGKRLPDSERYYMVRDNGKGMSEKEWEGQMQKVGDSLKKFDPNKFSGKQGLGLMAHYGKGKYITVTTTPQAEKGKPGGSRYLRHLMHLVEDRPDGRFWIPSEDVKDLIVTPSWNTEVYVSDFKVDLTGFRLDSLVNAIHARYGDNMRLRKTQIIIDYTDARGKHTRRIVNPPEFRGQRFSPYCYNEPDSECGRVWIDLYRCKETTSGVVFKAGEGLATAEWVHFRRLAEGLLSKETIRALESGFLEGTIKIEKCEWNTSRKAWREQDEPAFLAALVVVEAYFQRPEVQDYLKSVLAPLEDVISRKICMDLEEEYAKMARANPDLFDEILAFLPDDQMEVDVLVDGPKPPREPRPDDVEFPPDPSPVKPVGRGSGGKGSPSDANLNGNGKGKHRERGVVNAKNPPFRIEQAKFTDARSFAWDYGKRAILVNTLHPFYDDVKKDEDHLREYYRAVTEAALVTHHWGKPEELDITTRSKLNEQSNLFLGIQIHRIKSKGK